MPSPIVKTRSKLPLQKRQETTCDDSDSDDSEVGTPEEIQRCYEEVEKSQGFEIDFSKLTFCFDWKPLDLDDDTWVEEDEPGQTSNRDFIAMLCNLALTKHNSENNTNLELRKVLRANFHPSAAVTLYISFQANDPSDGNQTIPYRAVVRYLPGDIGVISCNPRPSS